MGCPTVASIPRSLALLAYAKLRDRSRPCSRASRSTALAFLFPHMASPETSPLQRPPASASRVAQTPIASGNRSSREAPPRNSSRSCSAANCASSSRVPLTRKILCLCEACQCIRFIPSTKKSIRGARSRYSMAAATRTCFQKVLLPCVARTHLSSQGIPDGSAQTFRYRATQRAKLQGVHSLRQTKKPISLRSSDGFGTSVPSISKNAAGVRWPFESTLPPQVPLSRPPLPLALIVRSLALPCVPYPAHRLVAPSQRRTPLRDAIPRQLPAAPAPHTKLLSPK